MAMMINSGTQNKNPINAPTTTAQLPGGIEIATNTAKVTPKPSIKLVNDFFISLLLAFNQ
jgi:hypothetical protein